MSLFLLGKEPVFVDDIGDSVDNAAIKERNTQFGKIKDFCQIVWSFI